MRWWLWYSCILRWRPRWWPVPHAYRVVSRAHCIHSSLCECALVNYVTMWIGETRWIMWTWWFGELYEFVIGELYHLVNLFDDDYLVIVTKCESYVFELVIFLGDDDFIAYTFEVMNCNCRVDYARDYVIYMIDVKLVNYMQYVKQVFYEKWVKITCMIILYKWWNSYSKVIGFCW